MALARQINKANIAKIARNSYSPKSSSMQYMESLNESDICLVLDFDPEIESYVTQPDSFINETNEPGWRRVTPDLLIQYKNGDSVFGECKPQVKTHSQTFQDQHARHKRIIKERTGRDLILFTEPELAPLRLTQLRQLKIYCNCEALSEVNEAVCGFLDTVGQAALGELEPICQAFAAPEYYPMVMLAHQCIRCVNAEVITRRSLVEVAL